MVVAATADLVHRFYDDLWNRWDDSLVPTLLSPDFAFRGSLGTSTVGHEGWRAYRDTVRAGSADFHNAVVTLVCEGSTAAARLTYSGPTPARCSASPPPDGASSTPAPRSSPPPTAC